MNLRGRLAEVQLAVMMLTRLPAGRLPGAAPDLVAARWAFPLVGAALGLMIWAIHAAALSLGLPPLVAALLALGGLALLTGALHFDGLADYADGIGGGRDKAHALDIMRDSRVGSYGVLAMILVTALWASSVAAAAPGPAAFVGAAALSRAVMVTLQETLPLARSDGMARLAAGRSRRAQAMVLAVACTALLLWPLPSLACAGVAWVVAARARHKIGGQTGDVLGAAQLASETAFWITLAAQTAA